jgi:diguanylate cyclase (GGDEF)-like protein
MSKFSLSGAWVKIPPGLKEAYRQFYFKQDLKQARITLMILIPPLFSFLWLDYLLLGTSTGFCLSAFGRLLFLALTIYLLLTRLRHIQNPRSYDLFVLAWLGIGGVFQLIGAFLRPADYSGNTVVFIVIIIFLYFGLPTRLVYWIIIGAAYSFVMLFALLFLKDSTGPAEILDTVLALVAVSAGGLFINRRIYGYKRDNFLAFQRINELASRDSLTGALNRRALLEQAEKEMTRFKRYGKPFCLFITDLDNFKRINDNHGHLEGDAVLKQYVSLVNSEIRSSDFFGRIGGEEFCMVLPETTAEDAVQIAMRISHKCAALDLRSREGDKVALSVSTGVSQVNSLDTSIDMVISRADEALYRAKMEGHNGQVHANFLPAPVLNIDSF